MNVTYDFKGQVALVAGAAMDVGLATACAFARSGVRVVLAGRNGAPAARNAEALVAEGAVAVGVSCDVTDEAQIAATVDWIISDSSEVPGGQLAAFFQAKIFGLGLAPRGGR